MPLRFDLRAISADQSYGRTPALESVQSTSKRYRADIDGLRAIAVMIVVLFHVGASPAFNGGFVGVDVFFVISGYLITGLLLAELEATGSIDYWKFYQRRMKRLLPALAAVCVATLATAAALFSAVHFKMTAGSFIAALASVSNIYFWQQSGYFDLDSHLKPLLHTWSLSVEEQFYLIWPFALAFVFKKSRDLIPLFVCAVFLASLSANIAFASDRSTIFYLVPFRLFELALGAICIWICRFWPRGLTSEIGCCVGAAMIAYATATFTETTTFPSTNALIPCVGAALLILGGQSKYAGSVLRFSPLVLIGKVSYSLYLVHWPIIVFYQYATLAPPDATGKALIVIASILLSFATFILIESPCRKLKLRMPARSLVIRGMSSIAMLMMVGTVAIGWATWKGTDNLELSSYGGGECTTPPCAHGTTGETVYVVGDSFARQLYDGLVTTFPDQRFLVFDVRDCMLFSPQWIRWVEGSGIAEKCTAYHKRLSDELAQKRPRVIIANNWDHYAFFDATVLAAENRLSIKRTTSKTETAEFIFNEIDRLKAELGLKDVLVIANPPGVGSIRDLDVCLSRSDALKIDCRNVDLASTSERRYLATFHQPSLPTIDPFQVFCGETTCTNYSAMGRFYSDRWHLSRLGSRMLVSHFKKDIERWMERSESAQDR